MGELTTDLLATASVVVNLPEACRAFWYVFQIEPLAARNPGDGEKIYEGFVYAARPNRRLPVQDGGTLKARAEGEASLPSESQRHGSVSHPTLQPVR